ncbi:DUF2243 domain-containing protein [Pseudanabaena sp. FACHB-2040]|uniref:DUF2243 domain-containing protein n=1 Tax=Pseudanabaena sp. FACHB-2040 TaxID=2692859 RepID=UPI001688F7A2|nr:DUF2243 domain-containing protein [Pseudanabaena sp. FACHB-2040]MBD2257546.1 DUF2243 domain-containing protein [Pseudanabaena sp. FACHB-2040]
MAVDQLKTANSGLLIAAGITLGIGQAGFFDGIVIHQLLQWHHMFSSVETDATVAGLELNTFGDGLFHLFDWLMTLLGIFLLWQVAKRDEVVRSTPLFVGALLLGFGLFNIFEGMIDHHLLGIHHVKSGPYEATYDIGFLVISGLIAISGWLLMRQPHQEQV